MSQFSTWTRHDTLLMALNAAVVIVFCALLSPKKPMWLDEHLTWFVVNDPSWRHFWSAAGDTINTSPPLYFVVARGWAMACGGDERSLRLLSALTLAACGAVMARLLRQHVGTWPAAHGAYGVPMLSIALWQSVEARFYAPLLFMTALCVWLAERCLVNDRPSWRQYVVTVIAHAALVFTHYFGLIYSAALAFGMIMHDVARRRWRPWAWLAPTLGWLILACWMAPLLTHLTIAQPRSHLRVPDAVDLWALSAHHFSYQLPMLGGLLLVNAALALAGQNMERSAGDRPNRAPLLALALALLLTPTTVWLFSRVGPTLWSAKYLMPSLLGWCIVVALLLERPINCWQRFVEGAVPLAVRWLAAAAPGLPLILLWGLVVWSAARAPNAPALGVNDMALTPGSAPIVIGQPTEFLQRRRHGHVSDRYVYVHDWRDALRSVDPGAPAMFKIMDALSRHYLPEHVLVADEFFARHAEFFALIPSRADALPDWLTQTLALHPRYRLETIGPADSAFLMVRARRR